MLILQALTPMPLALPQLVGIVALRSANIMYAALHGRRMCCSIVQTCSRCSAPGTGLNSEQLPLRGDVLRRGGCQLALGSGSLELGLACYALPHACRSSNACLWRGGRMATELRDAHLAFACLVQSLLAMPAANMTPWARKVLFPQSAFAELVQKSVFEKILSHALARSGLHAAMQNAGFIGLLSIFQV